MPLEPGSDEKEKGAVNSVLIIEDDTIVSVALRMLFERRGWVVNVAATLAQARGLLSKPVDWVVLDLLLPDGDGLELMHEMKDKYPSIQIVVTTGIRDRLRLESVRAAKPDALLSKPTSFSELLSVMEK